LAPQKVRSLDLKSSEPYQQNITFLAMCMMNLHTLLPSRFKDARYAYRKLYLATMHSFSRLWDSLIAGDDWDKDLIAHNCSAAVFGPRDKRRIQIASTDAAIVLQEQAIECPIFGEANTDISPFALARGSAEPEGAAS
jgi:hypothetical protein